MKNKAWLVILTALLVLQQPSHDQDLWAAALDKVQSIADILEKDYYLPVLEENLAFSSIRGTLDALDPHSYFLDPTTMSRMKEDYSGKYFGLGIQIQKQGENIVVVAPIEGSPAWRLGMQPGDIISHIEGESTIPLSSFDAMQKLRGEKGTKVTITVVRDGLDKPYDLTITREEIPLLSVPYAFMLNQETGYIYIRNFGETTPGEFTERLSRLRRQGMTNLVLDLRSNQGGTLVHSIEVADEFLPAGKLVVSVEGRNPAFNAKLYARRNNQFETLPLVVLIDHGTASASEIVSGAVMDHDRGLIVGEDSWGKGLVQTVFPLAPDAAVALTVAKYLTPSGRSIQRDFSQIDDYLLSKKAPDEEREVKYTAKGRKVLGQGGITPDYEEAFYLKPFTARLRFLGAFFGYARKLVQHQTELGKKLVFPGDQDPGKTTERLRSGDDFLVSEAVIEDFKVHLKTLKVEYDEKTFADSADEIRMELKREITGAVWGVDAGVQASRKSDPVVRKALEVMPEAAKMVGSDPSRRE